MSSESRGRAGSSGAAGRAFPVRVQQYRAQKAAAGQQDSGDAGEQTEPGAQA